MRHLVIPRGNVGNEKTHTYVLITDRPVGQCQAGRCKGLNRQEYRQTDRKKDGLRQRDRQASGVRRTDQHTGLDRQDLSQSDRQSQTDR